MKELCTSYKFYKGKLLVYSDNLSICELAKAYHVLQGELQIMKSATYEDIVDKAALMIRDDVKNQDNVQAWPPHIPEEEQDSVKIPDSVIRFLHTLLTGIKDCKNPSQRVQRLCNSFERDLVYAITCGRTNQ